MRLQKIASVYSCRLLLLGYLVDTMLFNMHEACKALCLKITAAHCKPRSKVKTTMSRPIHLYNPVLLKSST